MRAYAAACRSVLACLAIASWIAVTVIGPSAPVAAAGPSIVGTLNDDDGTHIANCLSPTNTDCTLRDAVAAVGSGGIIQFKTGLNGSITLSQGTLVLGKSMTITGPTATAITVDGGGSIGVFVVNASSTVTMSNLTIRHGHNTSSGCGLSGNGGAGICNKGALTILNSTIRDNSAMDYGGGLGIDKDASATVINSTFVGNSAGQGGGAIDDNGALTVINTTVTGNATQGGGGGINLFGQFTPTNLLVAQNTAAGTGPDVSGSGFTTGGGNLVGISNGSSGWSGGDITGTADAPVNPLLGPIGSNGGPTATVPLLPGSPAMDAGNDAICGTAIPNGAGNHDQRGITRPIGVHCDIGAFEGVSAPDSLPPSKPGGLPSGSGSNPLPASRPSSAPSGTAPQPLPPPR
jgi:hypothetical protein